MTLWNGRFAKEADGLARRFGDSIEFDRRLALADIRGSIAYAGVLARAGLITDRERDQIVQGLKQVCAEFSTLAFQIKPDDEDIHSAVERRLTELIGPMAGKLATGRSRNDQVACDLRLYLLGETASLRSALVELLESIVDKSEAHLGVIMPGYTHLRQAQPLLFSHWLMSFFWKFWRDLGRLADVERHTRVCPLGAGALAGNPFQIDRQALAADLGFASITENSVDAISDRDFALEFLFWAALAQVHLSQLAEDIILWSTQEFGFVELDERYCTGSSLMPQKKNPDVLELMRGKAGRIIGHLVALLSVLKGLPSGYNKDLQEDKEAVFDVLDTLTLELPLAAGVIHTLKVNKDRISFLDDGMLATDLADYLVRKGVPFRRAHHLVGQAVRRAEELAVSLRYLPYHEYQSLHPAFAEDLYAVLDFRRSVEARDVKGGTASSTVRAQIERAKALITKRKEEENGGMP